MPSTGFLTIDAPYIIFVHSLNGATFYHRSVVITDLLLTKLRMKILIGGSEGGKYTLADMWRINRYKHVYNSIIRSNKQ